jgi:hypothetical protein
MQVLAASVNGQEVLDGGNWLLENKSLEGTALDDAAKKAGFGAAMTALFHFPDVVDLMCTQLDWTQQLGAAFSADQAGVLASVQRLRAQAKQYGTLKTTPQQTVTTQTDNGKQVIVIQPANPQVVYVPQYNPQTVYVQQSGPSSGDVAAGKPQSPMGPAVAEATAEGYGGGGPEPYHGYIYKRLSSQGPAAPGGAKNYIVNDVQSGGFALLAYPAKYGTSGIMAFIVNQDGVIYQKDLGDATPTAAVALATFNPDQSWSVVE